MSENTPLKSAIELCLAAYRITDKFPREEILTQKIRAKAIAIIEDLVYNTDTPTNSSRIFNSGDLEREIHVLFAYFSVAENQDWVNRKNFSMLRDEYRKLYREVLEQLRDFGERPENANTSTLSSSGARRGQERPGLVKKQARLTARQSKILGFLGIKEGGQAISDIAGKIQTSNKTAERELKKLIGMGRVHKQGNTRGARFLAGGETIIDN